MWQRQGKFFNGIDGRAQCPVVDINNDGFWRIYFSHRDGNNHSYTSYIDIDLVWISNNDLGAGISYK